MADLLPNTPDDVATFVAEVGHEGKRQDAYRLDAIFREATGFIPRMWGPSIIGYGRYDYVYESGHSGTCHATGFSPRKARHSIYIMPGYADFSEILSRIGKHKTGAACLYVNKLADIDEAVLSDLIKAGLADLATRWTIHPDKA